jgi:iron complex transport system substrate-binding protein
MKFFSTFGLAFLLLSCQPEQNASFSAYPQKVVSLSLSIDEILMDTIGPERILALSSLAEAPGLSNILDRAALVDLRSKPELEYLLNLQGDLYLLPDWTDPRLIEGLEQFNKNLAVLPTPGTMEEILIQFDTLQELLGPDPGFSQLKEEIQTRLQNLSDNLKDNYGNTIPTIIEWTPDGRSGGPGSLLGVMIRLAGGTFPEIPKPIDQYGWWTVDKEELRKANPDYLMLPSWFWSDDKQAQTWLEEVTSDPYLAPLKALQVQNGTRPGLIQVPEAFKISSNHNLIRGMEYLQSRINPSSYPEGFYPPAFGLENPNKAQVSSD